MSNLQLGAIENDLLSEVSILKSDKLKSHSQKVSKKADLLTPIPNLVGAEKPEEHIGGSPRSMTSNGESMTSDMERACEITSLEMVFAKCTSQLWPACVFSLF